MYNHKMYDTNSECKTADMMQLLRTFETNQLHYVCIDYTRDDENYGALNTIERIRDGRIQATKYESETIKHENPVVILMSNKELEWDKLSLDRWKVWQLDDKGYTHTPWDSKKLKKAIIEKEMKGEKRKPELVDPYDESVKGAANKRGKWIVPEVTVEEFCK